MEPSPILPSLLKVYVTACVLQGLIFPVLSQCYGIPLKLTQSGTIHSPAYPKPESRATSCEWIFENEEFNNRMLVLNVVDIKLFFEAVLSDYLCSGKLVINKDIINCKSEEPFCRVYYSSPSCSSVKYDAECVHKSSTTTPISVKYTSNEEFGLIDEAKGFKLNYTFVDCPPAAKNKVKANLPVSTTHHIRKTNNAVPVTDSRNILLVSRSLPFLLATNVTRSTDSSKENDSSALLFIYIALPCGVTVIIIAIILLACYFWRRNMNQHKKESKHSSNLTREEICSATSGNDVTPDSRSNSKINTNDVQISIKLGPHYDEVDDGPREVDLNGYLTPICRQETA